MFQNPFRLFRSYYAGSCEDELGVHTCSPCNSNREFARTRSAALIAKDYLPALMVDPTLEATWTAGIAAGKITVIPDTAGSYDPGDPSELKGYGDNKSSNGPREQTLNFFDPNYRDNYAFYNSITNISSKVVAFRTSSLIHIADVTASIVAKDNVEDDLTAEVTWNVTAKWTSVNIPSIHDASGLGNIFKCS